VDASAAKEWAAEQGYGDPAFAALVDVATSGPALGQAYAAWRRGDLTDTEFDTALQRQAIAEQWFPALRALKENPLEPAEIAKAIHRGIMAGAGLLIASPPTTPGHVPSIPPSSIDPVTEAAWSGIEKERLRIMVGNAGLPPGLIEMLRLYNLGEVTRDDVQRAVAESNLRNEYQDVVFGLARRLLTPSQYEEAALRGVISNAEADTGAALSGMEKADAELLFEIMGRPLPVHQITTGLARGGTYGGTYTDIPEPYRDAVRRSNIRPEYAVLAHANRYTYPSAFVLRALATAGELTEKEVEAILLDIGWPPDLVAKIAPLWAGGAKGVSDPHVTKAQTQLWGTLHKSYVDEKTDKATAASVLTTLGVAPAAQPEVLALWDAETQLVRRPLTPAQIKKAIGEPGKDAAWATVELEKLGMSADDAATFLAE